ncbi:MAG: hypothetical protein OSA43_11670, partial [Pirellulales bacterium]|nr:hypothetical protein [Pirellulales bacterium]
MVESAYECLQKPPTPIGSLQSLSILPPNHQFDKTTTETTEAYFTAFAPPAVQPDEHVFLVDIMAHTLELAAEVTTTQAAQGKTVASSKRGPLHVARGVEIAIGLLLPTVA